ncbi:MAG TPA: hypothetical protein VFO93_08365 [Hymenobacter sp.]|uniref:hypothetical protein n=1 Tax=Hymenobacter sp. TaxID=1898978 RepID=UPI002D7FF8EE|nr:hypothetical protein [Hymenobacter sp.]HET9503541.1 hypothetical protein [Hymenobacter sp.]
MRLPARLRKPLRYCAFGLTLTLLAAALAVWGTGDFGLTQRWLNGAERRALAGRSTRADRLGLRLFYDGLWLGGKVAYPQAAELLGHYRAGSGDTLRFAAGSLLRHPEVRRALRQGRPGITFRQQAAGASPFYVVCKTDWPLYYAFDLLYIRQRDGKVVFYDNYFFQPVARRSYARFRVGKIGVRLNDGLIRVAYPQARAFVACSEAVAVR